VRWAGGMHWKYIWRMVARIYLTDRRNNVGAQRLHECAAGGERTIRLQRGGIRHWHTAIGNKYWLIVSAA